MEKSTLKKIEGRITGLAPGSIIFPSDFADAGNAEVVKKSLLRLERRGVIKRIAFGIYLFPKTSALLGVLTPTMEEIAQAIAQRDKARIIPTGVYAQNRLGLSTQVPMNAVYLTDGAARKIRIGKRSILFKKAAPKNLAAVGEISGLVIQALKTIGKNQLASDEEQRIMALLEKEPRKNREHDMLLAPEWIRSIIKKSLKGEVNAD